MPSEAELTLLGESASEMVLGDQTSAAPTDGFAELLVAYDFSTAAATALDYGGEAVSIFRIDGPLDQHRDAG